MSRAVRLPIRTLVVQAWRGLPRIWGAAWVVLLLAGILAGATVGWTDRLAGPALLLILVAVGAALRITLAGSVADARALGLGPLGFQLRRTELRLLGSSLLCLLCWTIVAVTLALVVLALFGGAELDVQAIQVRDWAAVGPPWRLAVLALVTLGSVAVLTALAARLSLAGPATVQHDRMISVAAMQLSRGHVIALTCASILTTAPAIALLGLAITVAGPVAAVAVAVLLWLPLAASAAGTAYRQLSPRADAGF